MNTGRGDCNSVCLLIFGKKYSKFFIYQTNEHYTSSLNKTPSNTIERNTRPHVQERSYSELN